jgi:glycosyltransferase involved in cell wall biosynthesis
MSVTPIRVGLFLLGVGPSPSGVWTRLRELVTVLKVEPGVELFAAVTSKAEQELLGLPSDRTLLVSPMGSIRRAVYSSRIARSFVREFDLDVLQVESMPIPQRTTVPTAVSLHDLREFDLPVWHLRSPGELYRRALLPRQARRVDAIFSLTQWMKHEIERQLSSSNVHVVSPIAPHVDLPSDPSERLASFALDRPFVLTLGHLEPRKNIEVLIRASSERTWPPNVELVIAGTDHGSLPRLKQMAEGSPATITFLDTVSDDDKWWLLTHASVVAVPSLIEGFGIVALEAIFVGTPVLVADAAALPEVVGDRRAVLLPDDHESWSQRIRHLVCDPTFRSSIIEREAAILPLHSRDAVAKQLLAVYRDLMTGDSA